MLTAVISLPRVTESCRLSRLKPAIRMPLRNPLSRCSRRKDFVPIMEPFSFLRDLLIVFAVAAAVVFLFQRLRVPSVVGLLVAGVLIGPYGLSLIHDTDRVKTMAEIGVVVLLFAVGLEFNLPRLVGMGRLMAGVGLPQVLFCEAVGVILTW